MEGTASTRNLRIYPPKNGLELPILKRVQQCYKDMALGRKSWKSSLLILGICTAWLALMHHVQSYLPSVYVAPWRVSAILPLVLSGGAPPLSYQLHRRNRVEYSH